MAALRGLVVWWQGGLVRGRASLAVWRRHRPTLNPAVYLLSMVFGVGALLILGVWGGEIQRPCLEGVLPLWGGCSPWPGTHS